MRVSLNEIIKLIEVYMTALSSGDFSLVKFSQNIKFLGPLMDSSVQGISDVIESLIGVSASVKDLQVLKYIDEGSDACVLIQFVTIKGELFPILDYIEIDEEGISNIKPIFDPPPSIELLVD